MRLLTVLRVVPWIGVLLLLALFLKLNGQSRMGPLVGTRLPLWDQLTNRYWISETCLDWDHSFGLRQNKDGTQTIYVKPPAGFVSATVDGSTSQVWLDMAYVVTQAQRAGTDPAPGSDCLDDKGGSARMWVGDTKACFCVPPKPLRTDSTGWTWKCLPWATQP